MLRLAFSSTVGMLKSKGIQYVASQSLGNTKGQCGFQELCVRFLTARAVSKLSCKYCGHPVMTSLNNTAASKASCLPNYKFYSSTSEPRPPIQDPLDRIVDHLKEKCENYAEVEENAGDIVKCLLEMKVATDEIEKHLPMNSRLLTQPVPLWKLACQSLLDLGFSPNQLLPSVTHFLTSIDGKLDKLTLTIDTLRALGFRDGQIQAMVLKCPSLVDCPSKKMIRQFGNLLLLFPRSGFTRMLERTPSILISPMAEVQHKYDYVLNEMGVDMKQILKSDFLRYDFSHLYSRHQFLHRAGLYHKPDKHGITPTPNALFKEIVDSSNRYFALKVANMAPREYTAFVNLCNVQLEHGLKEHLDDEGEDDDDDDKGEDDS